jgi:hypothetical protein
LKLLNKDPNQRLGCGGEGNDFTALKSHPFFNSIDWDNLHKLNPPIQFYFPKKNNFHSFSPQRISVFDQIIPLSKCTPKSKFAKNENSFTINLIPVQVNEKLLMEGK